MITQVDPTAVELITRVMEETWPEAAKLMATDADVRDVHAAMVTRIADAIDHGERDFARLKTVALEALPVPLAERK